MIKLLKNTIVSVTLITSFTALNLQAETLTLTDAEKQHLDQIKACEDTLHACDAAVERANALLKAKDAIMELRGEQVKELSKANADLQADRDSLLRSPIVWFLVGVAVGGLSYGLVTSQR